MKYLRYKQVLSFLCVHDGEAGMDWRWVSVVDKDGKKMFVLLNSISHDDSTGLKIHHQTRNEADGLQSASPKAVFNNDACFCGGTFL